jgi:hypothetical protein
VSHLSPEKPVQSSPKRLVLLLQARAVLDAPLSRVLYRVQVYFRIASIRLGIGGWTVDGPVVAFRVEIRGR